MSTMSEIVSLQAERTRIQATIQAAESADATLAAHRAKAAALDAKIASAAEALRRTDAAYAARVDAIAAATRAAIAPQSEIDGYERAIDEGVAAFAKAMADAETAAKDLRAIVGNKPDAAYRARSTAFVTLRHAARDELPPEAVALLAGEVRKPLLAPTLDSVDRLAGERGRSAAYRANGHSAGNRSAVLDILCSGKGALDRR